jgi:3-oxoacyl-[acyl-carrier protein] reductase
MHPQKGEEEKGLNKFIDFTNQVCLITGAGSREGIGFETARQLGDLGGKVILVSTTDRIHERALELTQEGISAQGYIVDLMDRKQVRELIERVMAKWGRIDVLINNAGMSQVGEKEEFATFAEMSHESWDFSIRRNLTICYNVTREVLPHMVEKGYGRIVNVSSVTGPLVSNPGEAGYAAAKAGIVGMSKSIAIEVAKNGIVINNVLPGWIATASQTEGEKAGGENTPMGRSGTGEEVANMNVFLASKRAAYVTGQTFVVDGGNTIQEYKGPADRYYG